MKIETIHKIPCTRHINAKGSNAASEKPKQRAEKKLENDKLCGFNVTVAFISLLLQRMCVCVWVFSPSFIVSTSVISGNGLRYIEKEHFVCSGK